MEYLKRKYGDVLEGLRLKFKPKRVTNLPSKDKIEIVDMSKRSFCGIERHCVNVNTRKWKELINIAKQEILTLVN